uniref:Secreted protein n=1 Tax=Ixodes ricinus TaxID=34613 RepID=A0A6B0V1Q7_IXORI
MPRLPPAYSRWSSACMWLLCAGQSVPFLDLLCPGLRKEHLRRCSAQDLCVRSAPRGEAHSCRRRPASRGSDRRHKGGAALEGPPFWQQQLFRLMPTISVLVQTWIPLLHFSKSGHSTRTPPALLRRVGPRRRMPRSWQTMTASRRRPARPGRIRPGPRWLASPRPAGMRAAAEWATRARVGAAPERWGSAPGPGCTRRPD